MARNPTPWALAVLCAMGMSLYLGAISASFTSWDDDIYITRNPVIRELSPESVWRVFSSFSNCNYHPLTTLSFMLEFALVGVSPWLYHLDNVLLHLLATTLACLLTGRLLRSRTAAALTALIFLVHPLRVESVAWAAERKDVLCAVFYLGALTAYLGYLDTDRGLRAYALSLGLFLGALLSKAMAVTLPAVLLVILVSRHEVGRKRWLGLLPFWALGIVFAVVGYLAQQTFGAVKSLHGGTWTSHLLSIVKALGFYTSKLLVPHPLSSFYLLPPARSLLEPGVLLGLSVVALAATMAWLSFRRRRLAFLGLGFFAVTWAPVSGLVPTSTLVADRYMYLPSLGLLWPLALWIVEGLRGPTPTGRRRLAAGSLAALLLFAAACCFLTWHRVHAWQDGVTLWREALVENPENPYAHNQLAVEHLHRGEYRQALETATRSIQLGLDRPEWLFNLCLAYRGLGDLEREVASARGILAGADDFVPAWLVVLRQLRRDDDLEAFESTLRTLLERFPGEPGLLAARGDLHLDRGRLQRAIEDYSLSLRGRPHDGTTRLGLAVALARRGDTSRALDIARDVLALPGSVLQPGERERLRDLECVLEERSPELSRRLRLEIARSARQSAILPGNLFQFRAGRPK